MTGILHLLVLVCIGFLAISAALSQNEIPKSHYLWMCGIAAMATLNLIITN